MKSCIANDTKDSMAYQLVADHIVTGKFFWFKVLNGVRRAVIRRRGRPGLKYPFTYCAEKSFYFTDLGLYLAKGTLVGLTWKKGYLIISIQKVQTENEDYIQVSFCPSAKKIDNN